MSLPPLAPLDPRAVIAARRAVSIWHAWTAEDATRADALALLNRAIQRTRDALTASLRSLEDREEDRALVEAATRDDSFIAPLVAVEAQARAFAWLATHRVAVGPDEPDWTQPFEDAGYVIVGAGFGVTVEDLAALTDPTDAEIWVAIEPHIISRDAHYSSRAARYGARLAVPTPRPTEGA